LIPEEIINKKPSAELKPGQFDEDALLPYPILDVICKAYIEDYIEDYQVFTDTFKNIKVSEPDYYRIVRLINNAEFKRRQVAPIVKVSKTAFGIGRRIPICKGK
jgi:NH3-dependent NAD+ synthetase